MDLAQWNCDATLHDKIVRKELWLNTFDWYMDEIGLIATFYYNSNRASQLLAIPFFAYQFDWFPFLLPNGFVDQQMCACFYFAWRNYVYIFIFLFIQFSSCGIVEF